MDGTMGSRYIVCHVSTFKRIGAAGDCGSHPSLLSSMLLTILHDPLFISMPVLCKPMGAALVQMPPVLFGNCFQRGASLSLVVE